MSKLYPKLQTGGLVPDKSQKTVLTPGQQLAYERWKAENKYNESDDYDLAGYWKEEGMKGLQFPNLAPIEKFKEIESKDFPQLDDFYKNNKNTAGMYHGDGTISRNPYSDRTTKSLNKVMDLEKLRGVLEENKNDFNLPQLTFKIRGVDNNAFRSNKEYAVKENPLSAKAFHYIDADKKTRRETIASRIYIGDALLNQRTNSYVEPSKKQIEQTQRLIEYAHTKPNHLPDKFKRLVPFSNGDGYLQLSDESNVASQFDKRGQGVWQGEGKKAKFIAYQTGGTLSQLGYKRHSPYNQAPSLLIHTPTGSITMKEVDHPILGIGKGEIKVMHPEKEYQFRSNKILEIPMRSTIYPKKYQQGGMTPEMSPEQQQEIVRRVRNLRKTLGYNKTQGVPLDGIALRHKLHVNKHLIKQEDQELLGAFDENQILELMNGVPDDDAVQMGQNGMRLPLTEITYTHQPAGISSITGEQKKDYMLQRTVTPYINDRQIKKNVNTPKNPEDINFISNYYNTSSGSSVNNKEFIYPRTVPTEGNNHWNIDRFIIDPQYTDYKNLGGLPETPQIRRNILADIYKQKLLETNNRNQAFRSAKQFVKTEIDPRVNGAYFNTIKGKSGESSTNFGSYNNLITYRQNPTKYEIDENGFKKGAIDYFKTYEKLPSSVANKKYQKWFEEANIKGMQDSVSYNIGKMNQFSPIPSNSNPTEIFKKGGRISSKSKMYPKCKCGCGGVSVGKNKMFQQGGTMDVLDSDGNSQMTISGGERIFSRVATKRMRELNDSKNYKELGKFICSELTAQDKREPEYVKE